MIVIYVDDLILVALSIVTIDNIAE
jgi:hypothetical protein